MGNDDIRPVGMTLERALEIATAALDYSRPMGEQVVSEHAQVVKTRQRGSRVVSSSRSGWSRLDAPTRDRILRLSAEGKSAADIALLVGIASRTVVRVRAKQKSVEAIKKEQAA
jgi:DNA-binding NarL/FixJ family response regulator